VFASECYEKGMSGRGWGDSAKGGRLAGRLGNKMTYDLELGNLLDLFALILRELVLICPLRSALH
jgi:hypothetical protein